MTDLPSLPCSGRRRTARRHALLCRDNRVWVVVAWATLALTARAGRAQETPTTAAPNAVGARNEQFVVPDDLDYNVPTPDGFQLQGRAGLWGFRTFGRDDSIGTIELFPSILDDNLMLFGDARLFSTFQGQFGGNVGVGGRFRMSRVGRIFGGSFWYDADDSLETLFQQLGLSLETYGDVIDARTNLYFPIGTSSDLITNHLRNPHFVGNSLLYDRVSTFGKALPGVDYEIGVLLPGAQVRQHALRWFAGGYHFWGDDVDVVHGFKTRLEGTVVPSLDTQLEFTTDRLYGTNLMAAVTWTYFAGFKRKETTAGLRYDRMSEFVRRNYNVIVAETKQITPDVMALNAQTGQPLVVQHVGPGGNSSGTPEDPWGTIADAQAAGGDIIIVHSGTVFTSGIVLQSGQQLFGMGHNLQHFVNVQGYGAVALPTESGARPVFQDVVGDAVTLASNTIFAGFVIDDPSGRGVVGDGVSNISLGNVDVHDAGGDALFLHNPGGTATLREINLTDAAGAGLHIDGGNALVRFEGDITAHDGRSLLLQNTTDGLIDLTGATILDDGGAGVLIADVDGDVSLRDVTVRNSSGVGIDVTGGDGLVTFFGSTTVDNAGGTGFRVADREGDTLVDRADVQGAGGQTGVEVVNNEGDTQFTSLDVESQNGTALSVLDSHRLIVLNGSITAQGGTAVDIEGSTMGVALHDVSSDGAAVGLRIVDSDGIFAILGGTDYASGGTIENTGTAVLLDDAGTVSLKLLDLDANGTGISATDVDHLALNGLRVTDTTGVGLDGRNVKTLIAYNSLFSDGGGTPVRWRADVVGEYIVSISQSTVDTETGDGIVIETAAGAKDSSLNLTLQTVLVSSSALGSSGLKLAWDGGILANIIASQFDVSGDDGIGIEIDALSSSKLSQFAIGNNRLDVTGDHSAGIRLVTSGASNLTLGGNQITLGGSGSAGMEFGLAASADLALLQNTVTDNGGGGTGFQFDSVAGPATIEIGGNLIDLKGAPAFIDQGIFFQAITGTVTLKGTDNNEVRNATTPFFAPAGGTAGKIKVNGSMVP